MAIPDPAASSAAAAGRATRTAYPLLVLTAMLWAGNAVASKWAVGQVSPQVLTCLRWLVVCAVLLGIARADIRRDWPRLLPRWLTILLMGAGGYTAFNSLFYAAGTYTTTLNLALFQGTLPVLVILANYGVRGATVTRLQAVGVLVTLAGTALAATHGDWTVLTTLALNRGDVLMLIACLLYAGYTVALPSRPAVSSLSFFTAMAGAAFLTSVPLLAAEWAAGQTIWPTAKGWMIVVFVALGPSLGSQLAFMRGVELIGPNRAGVFVNLVPVFGAFLAVVLVGEAFRWHDGLALALVLGGILIAERSRRA
jgi:drug/metabolite transporter (DMT)-like permease